MRIWEEEHQKNKDTSIKQNVYIDIELNMVLCSLVCSYSLFLSLFHSISPFKSRATDTMIKIASFFLNKKKMRYWNSTLQFIITWLFFGRLIFTVYAKFIQLFKSAYDVFCLLLLLFLLWNVNSNKQREGKEIYLLYNSAWYGSKCVAKYVCLCNVCILNCATV